MSINETVDNGLQQAGLRHYRDSAQPVVDALVTREQDLCDVAAEAAAAKWGVDKDQVLGFLEEQGYHVHVVVDDSAEEEVAPDSGLLRQVLDRLDILERIARSRGLLR